MKIALSGKGGSGKTTIAGSITRILAMEGNKNILAIDGDSNPNLSVTLGIPKKKSMNLRAIPSSILRREKDPDGCIKTVLTETPDVIIKKYGIKAKDDITVLVMANVDHAGAG